MHYTGPTYYTRIREDLSFIYNMNELSDVEANDVYNIIGEKTEVYLDIHEQFPEHIIYSIIPFTLMPIYCACLFAPFFSGQVFL